MAKTNEYLDEAYQELVTLSADERKRLEYEAREKALRDYNSQMKSARDYGLKRGLAEGLERGIKQGSITSRAESILEILEDVGEIPNELRQHIMNEQDIEKLKAWLKLAAKVKNIEEFRQNTSL